MLVYLTVPVGCVAPVFLERFVLQRNVLSSTNTKIMQNSGANNGNFRTESPSLNGGSSTTTTSSTTQQSQEFLSMLWPYSQLFSPQYFPSQPPPPPPPTAMAAYTIPIYCPAKAHPSIDNALHFTNSSLIREQTTSGSNGNNNMTIQIGLQCLNQGTAASDLNANFRNKNQNTKHLLLNGFVDEDPKKRDSNNKLFEFTKLAVHGCVVAERVAKNHKYRPCFKKIDSLCARLKQDISRPDGVLNNLNSQGMAWAVKDFIFVFTRIINAWFILKGYVYNSSDGMKKVQAAFTSDFQHCFFAWQEITQHLIENIIESFGNLDEVVQKSRTNGGGSTSVVTLNGKGSGDRFGNYGCSNGGSHQNLDLSHLYWMDNNQQFKEKEEKMDNGGANGNVGGGESGGGGGGGSGGITPSSSSSSPALPTPIYNEAERDEFETYYKTGLYQSVQRKPEAELADKDFLNSLDIVNLFRDNRGESDKKTTSFNGETGDIPSKEHKEIDLIDKLILENNLKSYEHDAKESIPYILAKVREIKESSYFFSSLFMKNYFPGLEKVIKEIKDLRTIMIDAENGRYANVYEVMTDLKRIIKSCRQYLKLYHQQHLQDLVDTFQAEIEKILPTTMQVPFDE